MKRENISKAMDGVGEHLIVEAAEKLDLVGAPVAVKAGKKGQNAFVRFMNSGWGVAAVCALVAVGVMGGIIWAGNQPGTNLPAGATEETETEAEVTEPLVIPDPEETEPASESTAEEATSEEATSEEVTTEEVETEAGTEFEVCEHAFGDWQFTVTPTCTERGVRTRVCSVCQQTEDEDIPAGLHSYDDRKRRCTLCGTTNDMEFTSYGDGNCSITDAGRIRGDVVLPNYSPEGDLVIAIGEDTFFGSFQSIVWPEKLTVIGARAFAQCNIPDGFTLPEGLTHIGEQAFSYCHGLTAIHIPASVTEIGASAFAGFSTLTDITFGEGIQISAIPGGFAANTALRAITLPESVTSIGSMAFGHTDLQEISLPDGITSIAPRTFIGCTQLTSVSGTANLTTIGYEAFAECAVLTDLILSDCLTEIGYHAFRECSALSCTEYSGGYYLAIGQNPYAILAYGRKDVEAAVLHEDTRIAVGGAFEGNTSLISFTFTDSTTEIPDRFFYGCNSLTSVNIPSALTRVGNEAFYQCYVLPNLTLPEGVLTVGTSAFLACRAFTEMVLPDSITEIGARAFEGCWSMTSIKLPASLTAIPHSLFRQCDALRGTLVIPDGVTSIGNAPFYRCIALTTIVIPRSVKFLDEQAFIDSVYYIEYEGTMAEWEAIEKNKNWRGGRATVQAVVCTDGRIDYD
ncbi:MAG: leucine-rich repeat protein [Clostridia bacterium]|nr:leucine-rich repeat protein [Clostridia bacterium]